MLLLMNLAQAELPWWKLLVRDIPHDAGAAVVYILIGGFIFFIWKGSRKRPE
jgi:hypothetical protein